MLYGEGLFLTSMDKMDSGVQESSTTPVGWAIRSSWNFMIDNTSIEMVKGRKNSILEW